MALQRVTYSRSSDLPSLPGRNLFHSGGLFKVFEQSPGYTPYILTLEEEGVVQACLLVVLRPFLSWLPLPGMAFGDVYGQGDYREGVDKEDCFGQLLQFLTETFGSQCFLMAFRSIEQALFGYRYFRNCDFFPVNWLRIHNSLHSKSPRERLSASRRRQIKRALENGATMEVAKTDEEVRAFARMLKLNYASRLRKHFPGIDFFRLLVEQNRTAELVRIFVVKYKQRIIGGSVCLFSSQDVYLWFSGGLQKRYPLQAPGVLAVWAALQYAHRQGYRHMEYMDVGLPFRKHGYRDFILRFGGAQNSTRRWFRFRWHWLNDFLARLFL